jgi:AraC-like DNA-binding protein
MPKPRTEQREGYESSQRLLEELPWVGWYSIPKAAVNLGRHSHPDEYEITYQARGDVELWAEQDIYRVEPGDLYITKPGEVHGAINSIMRPCEFYWVKVALPGHGALPGLSREQTGGLVSVFAGMKSRCFPGSQQILQDFRALLAEHRNPGPHSLIMARAILHSLLVRVVSRYDEHLKQNRRIKSAEIQTSQEWVENNIAEHLTVAGMARAADLKPSRFFERFRSEIGYTPIEYLERRRIEIAKQLLCEGGASIAEIAQRVGFGSSQYFATVFRKLVAMTPMEFRKKVARHDRLPQRP